MIVFVFVFLFVLFFDGDYLREVLVCLNSPHARHPHPLIPATLQLPRGNIQTPLLKQTSRTNVEKDADKIQPKIPIGGRGVSGPQLSDFGLHFPDFHYLSLIIFELLSDHF